MSSLSCGLVGLPNVGKSTLFNALIKKTTAVAANYPFCTIEPNEGIVEINDPKLAILSNLSKSKKIIPAFIRFVDIAGLVKGASEGAGLGNQFLSHIRECDAIVQVVRCFDHEDVIHVQGSVDPIRDIEIINLELVLADMQMCDNIVTKMEKQRKKGDDPIIPLLRRVQKHLEEGIPLRTLSWSAEEKELLKPYPFLTLKKVIYAANVSEDALPQMNNPYVEAVCAFAHKEGSVVVPICARLEEELASLSTEEASDFLSSLGVQEMGLDRLSKTAFDLLDLITYITTGEIETRAWTITKGTTAQEAAGKIHSDLEKGFIRAEVVSFEDMVTYKGRVGAREAGKARSEGKEYVVRDSDVILFYHN